MTDFLDPFERMIAALFTPAAVRAASDFDLGSIETLPALAQVVLDLSGVSGGGGGECPRCVAFVCDSNDAHGHDVAFVFVTFEWCRRRRGGQR